MNIVTLPASLDERYFEPMVRELAAAQEERVLFDATHMRWADPYGMIGLLVLGEVARRRGEQPVLKLPENADVVSYMARMGFFDHADPIFEVNGPRARQRHDGASDVLLEITPIDSHQDVHKIVDLVNQRGLKILTSQLHYPMREAFQFSVILSEVCQNIIEHAEAGGWVATQTYNWSRKVGRKVVVIAVMDLGIGFRASLAAAHAARYDRWDDAAALEAAFMHAQSRFHDPGRGQGLQQIRKYVARWGGRISIRSGTARIMDVPSWDEGAPLDRNLPYLPGSQIGIVLPALVTAEAPPVPAAARGGRR
ncbi:MAG TPA: ATP-binding protein [Longimicrobiales bacterium]|nr:ATP-binding protein [Longimicrobiales bacterium]